MLLDSPNRERELFVLLRNARTRTDLPAKERKAVDEIWTTWMLRSSDAAKTQGNTQEAISILEAGVRMMPSDARLRRSLAGAFSPTPTPSVPSQSTRRLDLSGRRRPISVQQLERESRRTNKSG